jgi:NADH dehydrogenase FAD-containing subunit
MILMISAAADHVDLTQFVLGTVNHVDPQQKTVSWAGPEGQPARSVTTG